MAVTVRDQHQRAILQKMNALSGKYSRYQVYSDFVIISALAISNAVDKFNAPRREQQAADLMKRYTENEITVLAEMFGEMVMGLEENPNQDFLGSLFMLCEFGNDAGGQFFTPYSVCEMMSAVQGEDVKARIEERGFVSVNDCACGAGALLIAFANDCKRKGINYQQSVLFVAQDIDYLTACQCYLQMSLLGMPGYVYVGNTLTDPCTTADARGLLPVKPENCFFTPLFFNEVWTYRKFISHFGMMEKAAGEPAEKKTSHEKVTPAKVERVEKETPAPLYSENEQMQLQFF